MLRIFTFFSIIVLITAEWVDPHDMNFDYDISQEETQIETTNLESYSPPKSQKYTSNADMYLKRILSLILRATTLDFPNGLEDNYYEGTISLKITKENLEFLHFVTELKTLNSTTLRRIDGVLSEAMYVSYFNLHPMQKLGEFILNILANTQVQSFIIMGFIIIYAVMCYINNTPLLGLIKYGSFALFMISFYVLYVHESEIEVEKVQSGCLKLSDYFWDWSGGENKCRHEIVLWRVIEKMFRALIVIPLGIIGSGLGKFAGNLFYDLPWGFNIIMWPIMLIVSLVIFFYLTAILLGRSMSFSSFFLFGSKIDGKRKDDNESQVVYELRKQIVDLTERLNNVKITDTDEPVLQLTKNDFKEIVSNLQNRNKSSHDEIENVKEENIGEGIQSIENSVEKHLVIKKNE